MRLRARSSRPVADGTDVHDPAFELGVASGAGASVDRVLVDRALEGLAPDDARLLRDAFYAGYSHSELAEREGAPLGTIKSRFDGRCCGRATRSRPPPRALATRRGPRERDAGEGHPAPARRARALPAGRARPPGARRRGRPPRPLRCVPRGAGAPGRRAGRHRRGAAADGARRPRVGRRRGPRRGAAGDRHRGTRHRGTHADRARDADAPSATVARRRLGDGRPRRLAGARGRVRRLGGRPAPAHDRPAGRARRGAGRRRSARHGTARASPPWRRPSGRSPRSRRSSRAGWPTGTWPSPPSPANGTPWARCSSGPTARRSS